MPRLGDRRNLARTRCAGALADAGGLGVGDLRQPGDGVVAEAMVDRNESGVVLVV